MIQHQNPGSHDQVAGRRKASGFTLLEILVALFVFSILSVVLAAALRSVIRTESGVEKNAMRLRELQMALLVVGRDVEQAVNRPIFDTKGKEEEAFLGSPKSFVLTHLGAADALTFHKTGMKRTRYHWEGTTLWRTGWDTLDHPPQEKPFSYPLLQGVNEVRFQYLDVEGRFHDNWPLEGREKETMPLAVNVQLTMANWGKIRQLFVINGEKENVSQDEDKEQPPPND